jgi:hypothetical protein
MQSAANRAHLPVHERPAFAGRQALEEKDHAQACDARRRRGAGDSGPGAQCGRCRLLSIGGNGISLVSVLPRPARSLPSPSRLPPWLLLVSLGRRPRIIYAIWDRGRRARSLQRAGLRRLPRQGRPGCLEKFFRKAKIILCCNRTGASIHQRTDRPHCERRRRLEP